MNFWKYDFTKFIFHTFNLYPNIMPNLTIDFGLMRCYNVMDFARHWLKWWLAAWHHQTITWTNGDLSSSIFFESLPLTQRLMSTITCHLLTPHPQVNCSDFLDRTRGHRFSSQIFSHLGKNHIPKPSRRWIVKIKDVSNPYPLEWTA